MDEITQLQAEVLKTLASPRRLEIIHRLAQGPCEVRRLAEDLGASQPNISQHLAVLRSTGLVDAERTVGRSATADRSGRGGGLRNDAQRPPAAPRAPRAPVSDGRDPR
ncbi:MAG: metalloregulator ArsR/SmtB family transcription factor [Chloroflexota bacterium]